MGKEVKTEHTTDQSNNIDVFSFLKRHREKLQYERKELLSIAHHVSDDEPMQILKEVSNDLEEAITDLKQKIKAVDYVLKLLLCETQS